MFEKLNKIGELTKILSIKSDTSHAIMHFMRCFGIGRILSKRDFPRLLLLPDKRLFAALILIIPCVANNLFLLCCNPNNWMIFIIY